MLRIKQQSETTSFTKRIKKYRKYVGEKDKETILRKNTSIHFVDCIGF